MTSRDVIRNEEIAERIFAHLSSSDLKECALVNKGWNYSVWKYRPKRNLRIRMDLLIRLKNEGKSIQDYIKKNHYYAHQIIIHGWSRDLGYVPSDIYDTLFNSTLFARKLILKGRGCWDTCRCPNASGSKLIDGVKDIDKTNFKQIVVGETFTISSCAILDLISRSPSLEKLRFHGLITKHDHNQVFNNKVFHCNLERVYWPFPTKNQQPSIVTLAKRNDEITTFHSSIETVCDLIAAEQLLKLRCLSMNLNYDWSNRKGNHKKLYKYLEKTKYIPLCKNLEALELRTFDIDEIIDEDVARIYESYRVTLWEQISKLPQLKYLAVYGAWELEKVCSELAKYGLQIELFKTNLTPRSVIEGLERQDDELVLSISGAIKDIRRLASLRSISYSCADKLANISTKTMIVLKEQLLDVLWVLDIKVKFTNEVEEFIASVNRRGNQIGRQFELELLVSPNKPEYSDMIIRQNLRVPLNQDVKTFLSSAAERAVKDRHGQGKFNFFQLWGIKLIGSIRDKDSYEKLRSAWYRYEKCFDMSA